MIEVGNGPPLVLIPGIQGRWEWMEPLVRDLSRRFRVLTFTLAGEWRSDHRFDPRLGFDSYIVQVDRALEEAGVTSAIVCGVSYGGLIGVRYAALRPDRTRQLVLVSALPPDYTPDARFRFYERAPWLLLPVFCVDAACRASRELRAAFPRRMSRLGFEVAQGLRVLSAPASPARMRDRLELLRSVDFLTDAARVQAHTLLVTGDPGLDRTVPIELSTRYLGVLRHAEHEVLKQTGHLGSVTRPAALTDLVCRFVARDETAAASRRAG